VEQRPQSIVDNSTQFSARTSAVNVTLPAFAAERRAAVPCCGAVAAIRDAAKVNVIQYTGGSVAEWLACWTQAQKGPGSNRSHDAVG